MKLLRLSFTLSILLVSGILISNYAPWIEHTVAQQGNRSICDNSANFNISTATTTAVIVNADLAQRLLICGISATIVGTATANVVTFEYGATGGTCPAPTVLAPYSSHATAGVVLPLIAFNPGGIYKPIPVGNDVCILTTQAGVVSGAISYSKINF